MLARVKRSMEAIGQRTHVPVVTGVKMRLPCAERRGAAEIKIRYTGNWYNLY